MKRSEVRTENHPDEIMPRLLVKTVLAIDRGFPRLFFLDQCASSLNDLLLLITRLARFRSIIVRNRVKR
jgi:hypothetical protein